MVMINLREDHSHAVFTQLLLSVPVRRQKLRQN